MPETLTDAQKVLRNDTGIRMAAALEALASGVEPSTVIAPEYDAEQTYAVGDLVMRRSVLYRCTTPIPTPEEWTAAHWTATSVSGEYRPAAAQDAIDSDLMALGLTGASVGDLVRVKTVDANGKPTSWQKAPLCDITTNPNLLDNWYFVGGGSQQGDGVLPINQRGLTSYSTNGYCIDRWNLLRGSVELLESGLRFTSPSDNSFRIDNRIPYGTIKNILGKTCTFSALVNDSLCVFTTIVTESELTKRFTVDGMTYTVNLNFVTAWGNVYRPLQMFVNTGQTVVVKAAKLELGSEQTLAHQENGQWVLNEIPDYGQELAKCQRYLIAFKTSSNTRSFLAIGIAESASQYRAVLPTPVTMYHKINRTVELTGTVTAGSLTASSVASYWEENPGSITLFINVTGATVGDITRIMLEPGSTLTISAEL